MACNVTDYVVSCSASAAECKGAFFCQIVGLTLQGNVEQRKTPAL